MQDGRGREEGGGDKIWAPTEAKRQVMQDGRRGREEGKGASREGTRSKKLSL